MNRFLKFIARVGAVGGTARFVANGYRYLGEGESDRAEIFKKIIKRRFKLWKDEKEESEMLFKAERIDNLTDLTFLILQVEGVIPKDVSIFQSMEYMEIVREVLRKKGMSEEIIGVIS